MSQTVRPEVASFVTLVRAHLSDLTPEEVDELTGGLEADLDERLAETLPGDPPADLGDAAAYAAELRAAAGLPPRGAGGGRRAGAAGPGLLVRTAQSVDRRVRGFVDPVVTTVRRQPWWPEFRASVVALRPAWWIARAYVAWSLFAAFDGTTHGLLPDGFGGLVALLLFVGVSVALGRGLLDAPLRLDAGRWRRRIVLALNVFAVLALPFVLSSIDSTRYEYVTTSDPGFDGLVLNGEQVRNIYAYDAQGNPIGVVQLYDQNGRPLNVAHQPYTDAFNQQGYTDVNGDLVAPFVDDRSRNRWNVFPLPTASYPEPLYGDDGNPTATASPVATLPAAPLVAVPPITSVLGIPDGAALASGAPAPPTGPSASATPSPSAPSSASSGPSASPTASAPTSAGASAKASPAPSTTRS
ncbi:hypothetical protein [Kineosporia sp. R_H_3]|uniref:hypothetical protein n=1 Tax=Kineosporia sp. R_H_3 TaxID=1961848 RepID=UPI000B4B54C8|nr:hypothetical protein [Kineosporia sp. R_H_3]